MARTVGKVRFRLDLRQQETATLVLAFFLAGGGQNVAQRIRLGFTVPNYGGRRWWMICPVTGERVRCLFLPPGESRFASRGAFGLGYRVERLGHFDRPFEKLYRLQAKLDGGTGWGVMPKRRKGMWQRTFAQHLAGYRALEDACGAAAVRVMRGAGMGAD